MRQKLNDTMAYLRTEGAGHTHTHTVSFNFIQTCAPPGVDELIRFWARSAQRQGSKVNEFGLNMLFLPR